MQRRSWRLLPLVLLVATSCSGGGVTATLQDFSITLDPSSAKPGSVTFNITNNGPEVHEFVVFKTDIPEADLPTDEAGDVEEAGGELSVVDEVEDIAVDATPSLTVDLEAGSYVIICNITTHYGLGMHTSFTVA